MDDVMILILCMAKASNKNDLQEYYIDNNPNPNHKWLFGAIPNYANWIWPFRK